MPYPWASLIVINSAPLITLGMGKTLVCCGKVRERTEHSKRFPGGEGQRQARVEKKSQTKRINILFNHDHHYLLKKFLGTKHAHWLR